ncbi:unnamed protein product, partial [Vitis vinifera]|uniref:Uncharacterized protein n=1 Tax=Vitis vinifera TaxID=29760 RepID=D7U6J8_VITVI
MPVLTVISMLLHYGLGSSGSMVMKFHKTCLLSSWMRQICSLEAYAQC